MNIRRLSLSLLVLGVFIALTLLSATVYAQEFPFPVEVQRSANLRSGPGTSFDIVGNAAAGQSFTAISCNNACDWYEVGEDVWIAAFLVEMISSPTNPTGTVTLTSATPTDIPTLSADEQNYATSILSILLNYAEALHVLGEQLIAAGKNPVLIADQEWVALTAAAVTAIRLSNEDIRTQAPPPQSRFVPVHTELLIAAEKHDQAMTLLIDGIDTLNADKITESQSKMLEGQGAIQRANVLLQSIIVTFPATNIAENTPTPSVAPVATATPTPTYIAPSFQEIAVRIHALQHDGGRPRDYLDTLIGKEIQGWQGRINSLQSSLFMQPKDYWIWVDMAMPVEVSSHDARNDVKVMISEEMASQLEEDAQILFSAKITGLTSWAGLSIEANVINIEITQPLSAPAATATSIAQATVWTEILGTSTPTPLPTATRTPRPTAWYSGGTLHQATWKEWQGATDANKLATAADWITRAYKPEWETLDELRTLSSELIACLNEIEDTAIESYGADSAITDFVVMCILLMMDE